MKYFWLIRHAATQSQAASDIERQLSPPGHADGKLMTGYFTDEAKRAGVVADWLVTSAATRAQQTAQYVANGFGLADTQVLVEPGLYLAGPERLLSTLRDIPDEFQCVALVAHNPGLSWLVNELSREEEQIDNLPTLGSTLFCSTVEHWSDLVDAQRISVMTPRQFAGTNTL